MFLKATREVFSKKSLLSWAGVSMGGVVILPWIKNYTEDLSDDLYQREMLFMTSALLTMRIGYGVGTNLPNELGIFDNLSFTLINSFFFTILAAPTGIDIAYNIILPIHDGVISYSHSLYNKLLGEIYDSE